MTTSIAPACTTLPSCLLDAVSKFAQRAAHLMAQGLEVAGLAGTASQPCMLPRWFLLEYAAYWEVARWRRSGLYDANWGLPGDDEAFDNILQRLFAPAEGNTQVAPLSEKVLRIWVEHFAWSATELVGAELTVDCGDDEEFIDQLARFLLAAVQNPATAIGALNEA